MNVVRHIVDSVLSPSRGTAFFGVCVSIAGGLYFAGLTDGRPNPASAKAFGGPPIVKAEFIDPPLSGSSHLDPGAMRPVVTAAIPSDRPTLVRRLQAALTRVGCYGGPITGVWSEPSKSAMGRYVAVANAQLPVAEPDPALLALVESNDNASCGSRPVTTGAIDRPPAVPVMIAQSADHDDVIPPAKKTVAARDDEITTGAPADQPSMMERAWAPADMLVMPKDGPKAAATETPLPTTTGTARPSEAATQNIIVGSSSPDHEDDVTPSPVTAPASKPAAAAPQPELAPVAAAAKPDPVPPPAEQKVEVQPDPTAVPDPRDDDRETKPKKDKAKSDKAKTDKTKTAKRKSKYDQPSSFSEGLDSLQRSVSNIFN